MQFSGLIESDIYPLLVINTYSMSSSYYALALGDRPFPNLSFYQTSYFTCI